MTKIDRQKFNMQRTHANIRNIDWNLTFEEWYSWWIATGKYHLRGCRKGQYVMARYNDSGPYSLDNIFCSSVEQNNKDRHKFNPYAVENGKKNAKPIQTPDGLFKSKIEAARHYNIKSGSMSGRLKRKPEEYYYVVS
jgi:hypothetical protein